MKKSDIKNGMHVITKGGEEYIIINDVYAPKQIDDNHTANVIMINLDCGWMNFDQYDNDLRFYDNPQDIDEDDWQYDIEEVYVPKYYAYTFSSVRDKNHQDDFIRLWKRGIKKMTKAEIEAELGYEIEIVDDED